jgi:rare lipoprotein A
MKWIGGSFRRPAQVAAVVLCAAATLSGCQSSSSSTHQGDELAPEGDAPFFTSAIFGVKASPRMTRSKVVPKGGGRDQLGKPYVVRGKWYYPKEEPGYVKTGTASWYGANFHGRLTANGEIYDMYHLSAAHPTFPLPSYARVTNRKNGSSVLVRVNDRGPYMHDRVLDVSSKAAELLGFQNAGVADVKVEYVGRAPVEGDDTRMLMASYRPPTARAIDDGLASGVMIASRSTKSQSILSATAFRAPGKVPSLPGVNPRPASVSIESLIDTYDVGSAAPPSRISKSALSYAATPEQGGSVAALAAIVAQEVPSRPSNRIEIGALNDPRLVAAIRDLAKGRGDLKEERVAGVRSFSLDIHAGQDVDGILLRLWDVGASDAFVLRD